VLSPVLSEILFWLAAGICAVAQIAVLRAALAGRTPGASRSAASRGLELFWVVLPAVALLFVLLWTWRSLPSRERFRERERRRGHSRDATSHYMTLLRRLGWLSLVLGFGHIVFGAIVRITGSGMGCGDHWPKCHGYWIPPFERMDLIIEVSHRYFAATLSLAVVVLVLVSLSRRRLLGVSGPGGVLRPAVLSAVLVIGAALFGALTVIFELANKAVIVTHLAIAMSLLGSLIVAIVRAGGPPLLPEYESAARGASSFERTGVHSSASKRSREPLWHASRRTARGAAAAAGLVFIVLVLGALTAHIPGANVACQGFPLCRGGLLPTVPAQHVQFVHRLLAFALFFHLIALSVGTLRRGERRMAGLALGALGICLAQILVAAVMVELQLPPIWRSLHEAVGTLLWIVIFAFALVARRSSLGMEGVGVRASRPSPTLAGAAEARA
jgi:cytochrome c oxidase assembly protein subunit 15